MSDVPASGEPLCVVLCNAPPEHADAIADKLVETRLAACVNAIPGVVSTYRWEGKVEKDQETTLLIKTRQALIGDVVAAIREVHPYDVPEVIAMPLLGAGEPSYLAWVGTETRRDG